ncbi:MAG: DUF4054 domain-containing protein [Desulfobulbaceae bacterium]|nr:DUF4054 domain-containing protein [Desulfobulbaceae bacterium]
MTTGVVTFEASDFKEWFPGLSSATTPFLTACFARSEGLLCNTTASPVQDVVERKRLLYLATAHIATLENRGAQATGAITSAGKGSVNTAFAALAQPGRAAWWNQTQYGAEYWEATKPYRSMIYVTE